MQFTQLTQLESFSVSLHPQEQFSLTPSIQQYFTVQSQPPELPKLLRRISEINLTRSASLQALQIQDSHEPLDLAPKKNQDIDENETVQFESTPKQKISQFQKKSNIFTPSRGGLQQTRRSCSLQIEHAWEIRVYFFGGPTYLDISYTKNTRIEDLIRKAIEISSTQVQNSQIFSMNPLDYELRFPENEESFAPDLSMEPISYSRYLSESIIDTLVLMRKERRESTAFRSSMPTSRKQSAFEESGYFQKGLVKIYLQNEASVEIGSIILPENDTLARVFQYLKGQLHSNFILTEELKSDFHLVQDLEVRDLATNILFVKTKKYMDEPENILKPFKVISKIPKNLSPKMAPIGITEASTYEEFQVVKINRRGAKQNRILGIDQTKIYNYDPAVRTKNQEAGLFSKLMGNSTLTGTKTPHRLVSDIQDLRDFQPLLFEIVFKDKNIQYVVKKTEVKERILRKLRYLTGMKN